MEFNEHLGTGRIKEIINALKSTYGVTTIRELNPEIKLNSLLTAMQLDINDFDCLIADNSPVFRTIKGHAFEIVFEYIVKRAGYDVIDVGGDGAVDLIVNGYKLQLKTPYSAGTRGQIIQYKTHKTHGAKSESESMDYYHNIDEFADFLVGLVSYDPFRILILKNTIK
jgi:hypothetical protein